MECSDLLTRVSEMDAEQAGGDAATPAPPNAASAMSVDDAWDLRQGDLQAWARNRETILADIERKLKNPPSAFAGTFHTSAFGLGKRSLWHSKSESVSSGGVPDDRRSMQSGEGAPEAQPEGLVLLAVVPSKGAVSCYLPLKRPPPFPSDVRTPQCFMFCGGGGCACGCGCGGCGCGGGGCGGGGVCGGGTPYLSRRALHR